MTDPISETLRLREDQAARRQALEMTEARHSAAHPGFGAVQKKIMAKGGYTKKQAGAILAKASRGASSHARHSNKRLKKV